MIPFLISVTLSFNNYRMVHPVTQRDEDEDIDWDREEEVEVEGKKYFSIYWYLVDITRPVLNFILNVML